MSLLVTLVIAMPIAFLSTPTLIRWNMSRWIVSSDMQHRQRALNYVAGRADSQPKVRDMAIEALSVPDDINFQQIFHALDVAGQWQRPPVTNAAWLRWLDILGHDKDAQARIMAIRQTTDMTDLANDKRLISLFSSWLVDGDPQVRYNALIALADLSGHAKSSTQSPGQPSDQSSNQIQQLLASMTADPLPNIAAEAWLFLGLLDPASGKVANWRQADPAVAAAILWATMRTNPDRPAAAIEALKDAAVPASVRASAAYALHVNHSPETSKALQSVITPDDISAVNSITDANWIAWRAILSLNEALPLPVIQSDEKEETARPMLWAALYKNARQIMDDRLHDMPAPTKNNNPLDLPAESTPTRPPDVMRLATSLADRLTPERLLSHPVSALAILEGLDRNSTNLGPCPETASPYVKLAWTRATLTPSVETLRDLFTSDSAPVRDSACVIAWQRFDDATNTKLIASLLRDYNDNAKRSGAILAGLTKLKPTVTEKGVTTDLLLQKMENEDIWTVKQIHRVGLWMQGRLPEMDHQMAGLMSRHDLPISTLILAMLYKQPVRAMNELFSPLTDPPQFKPESLNARTPADHAITLMDLLVQYRWLHVLQALQPKQELTLWLWADTGLQEFQLQVIRDHWLLTRPNAKTAWTADEELAGPTSP